MDIGMVPRSSRGSYSRTSSGYSASIASETSFRRSTSFAVVEAACLASHGVWRAEMFGMLAAYTAC